MSAAPAWRRPSPQLMPLRLVSTDTLADLDQVLAGWRLWQQSANLSERTIYERASTIRNLMIFCGSKPTEITPADIIAFITRDGIGNSTKATYHATIRVFSEYLIMSGQRDDNPTFRTPKPRRNKGVPRPITPEQLTMLLATVNRKRTRMMIMLAAFAGLRVHEIAKIRGEDFDFSAGLLYVTGKGSKRAVLPIHDLILAGASEFPEKGFWFPSYEHKGSSVCSHAVNRSIGRTMERAGFKATPHQLRHYFGTALCRNGVDLRTVQELMRHESLATTALYIEISDVQRQNAISGLFATV